MSVRWRVENYPIQYMMTPHVDVGWKVVPVVHNQVYPWSSIMFGENRHMAELVCLALNRLAETEPDTVDKILEVR